MEYSVTSLITDIALASLLIFTGQILRAKIKIIQKFFLPAPLIAGFLGLLLGPEGLAVLPFSSALSNYPYTLIIVLFGSLFIGRQSNGGLKKMITSAEDTFLLNMAAETGQFGFALVIGTSVFALLFPDLHSAFALMMPAGFAGGHGYAASIGGTLQDIAGWEEAITIGQTFATIGLILGVLIGIAAINYAIKKGYTQYITNMSGLPESMRTGFFNAAEQKALGRETTCSISLETLTWHLALILMAAGGAYLIDYLYGLLNLNFSLPMVCLSMFCGVFINWFLKLVRLDKSIDRNTISRVGSSITDYLVFFGIASIRISVVSEYLLPIIIMSLLGVAYCLFYVFVICKKLYTDNWFERGIFIFGWNMGVVAIGIILLRIVDPDMKSGTLEDYGFAYVLISIIELAMITFIPVFAAYHHGFLTGCVLLIFFAFLLISAQRIKKRNQRNLY